MIKCLLGILMGCFFAGFSGFFLISLNSSISTVSTSSIAPVTCFLIFLGIVGLYLIIASIVMTFVEIRRIFIKKHGYDGFADFISAEERKSTYSENNKYRITFSYIDEKGKQRTHTTEFKYYKADIEYFENKKSFAVKFKGKTVFVTENPKIIYTKNSYASTTSYDQPIQTNKNSSGFYMCEYCGSSQNRLGKCKNCGAKITK
ncbi:MAG: hypothetical protein IJD48_01005 [Clostridia bacterium]|nr:hypothetical protein [Clostridia bacterium]